MAAQVTVADEARQQQTWPGGVPARRRRPSHPALLAAGVWLGLVLLLGAGLYLRAALEASFDVPRDWTVGVVVQRFWSREFARTYLCGLVALGGLLVPIAALARRGGGRYQVFLAGGALALALQVAALHVAMIGHQRDPRVADSMTLLLDFVVFVLPLVVVVAVPAVLVGWEWEQPQQG